MDDQIFELLRSHTGLAALVGDRIYPTRAGEQTPSPYCVYLRAGGGRDYTHQGYSGLAQPRVQISCFGKTHKQARQVADQVILAMESWGIGAMLESDVDFYDEEAKLFHIPLDFVIWYEEA